MPRLFVKPLWNVKLEGKPRRTTLKVESVERRFATGRGYCVTADSADEASAIVWRFCRQQKYRDTPSGDAVQVIKHRGVPVLMDAPRW